MRTLKVSLSPTQLKLYKIQGFRIVVVDVLRATTAISTALAHGAKKVITATSVEEIQQIHSDENILIGAERDGMMVDGFKRGNSPYDYMENMKEKTIGITTTNGTMAIDEAKKHTDKIILGSFVSFSAVVDFLVKDSKDVIILCSGWKNRINLDDTYFAGAMVEALLKKGFELALDSDAAVISRDVFLRYKDTFEELIEKASHTKRLKKLNLREDVDFCFQYDVYKTVPVYRNGAFYGLEN